MLPLNLSAAPTRCSTGMHRCRIDQSRQQAVCVRKCVQEFLYEQHKKKQFNKKGEYAQVYNFTLHMYTDASFLICS